MCNKIGYLEHDASKRLYISGILNKVFNKINIYNLDENKMKIVLNKTDISDKYLLKILKVIKFNQINIIAISNKININPKIFFDNKIKILDGKKLMKNMILPILDKIFLYNGMDMRSSDIYFTVKDDKEIKLICELAQKFRCINIVTDRIKKLNRLESKLDKNDEIIYSISSNRNKSLRRADIIVNFDYDTKFFNEFKVNRNAILVNLSNNKIIMKSSFQGIIIENIDINFENYNNINFEQNILYESYIYNLNYEEFKLKCIKDKCRIKKMIGTNGEISAFEIKKINKT